MLRLAEGLFWKCGSGPFPMGRVELDPVDQVHLPRGLGIFRFWGVAGLRSRDVACGHSIATKFIDSRGFTEPAGTSAHAHVTPLPPPRVSSSMHQLGGRSVPPPPGDGGHVAFSDTGVVV